MNDIVIKLLTLCLKTTEEGNDAFFHYWPHAQHVEIEVFKGKWKRCNNEDYAFYKNIYFFKEDSDEPIDEEIISQIAADIKAAIS